jgi:hypothetical protein
VGESEPEGEIYFNGVNGGSGRYALPALSADQVFRMAKGETLDPHEVSELRKRLADATGTFLGMKAGGDPSNLADAGWGIVFSSDADPGIRDALKPLLEHRQEQASAETEQRFRVYAEADALRPGETSQEFRIRHKVGLGDAADPDKMPYYLLLVGDPERIPFRVQYQLDVTRSIGRIHFESIDDYARYAQSVVESELAVAQPATATLFGVRNHDDRATTMSADLLVQSLANALPQEVPNWSFSSLIGDGETSEHGVASSADSATQANLQSSLGGPQTPTLFFSASHGMAFDKGDPRQAPHQGALLCQDWPGPQEWRQPVPPEFYFSAENVGDDANVGGLIAFFFACYGAGTPKNDDFAAQIPELPPEIAPHAFVAQLPQRLLGHPNGGALAVVGHVERAWGYSFMWPRIGEQVDTFVSMLASVMKGLPIGLALEFFNDKYAALATELEDEKENIKYGAAPDPMGISGIWTARNDARNYVVIGDPAVRIRTAV